MALIQIFFGPTREFSYTHVWKEAQGVLDFRPVRGGVPRHGGQVPLDKKQRIRDATKSLTLYILAWCLDTTRERGDNI